MPKIKTRSVQPKGFRTIFESMKYNYDDEAVVEAGLCVLLRLSWNNQHNKAAITDLNGIPFITNAMRDHEGNVRVQEAGFCALFCLAYDDAGNAFDIVEAGEGRCNNVGGESPWHRCSILGSDAFKSDAIVALKPML